MTAETFLRSETDSTGRGPSVPTGRPSGAFERWLLWSLPPLEGRLRFVFYAGSLALFAFLNDGLDFTLSVAAPSFYEPDGLAAVLRLPYFGPTATRWWMAGLYTAWLCAAVGLFTRTAKIATAVGFFVAVGLEQAYETGTNHTHYLLLYCFVALCFTTSDLGWSVNGWRSRRPVRGHAEPDAPSGLGSTGVVRHALLIAVVALYWSAGFNKLLDGGLAWANGSSLQYYIGSQVDRTSFAAITSLRTWVASQQWLCALFSVASLLLELSSPLALISRRLRHLFIPAWVAMHVAIVLLMNPNYWIHSWCVVVLFTDWEWVAGLARAARKGSGSAERPAPRSVPALAGPAWRPTALGASLFTLAFLPALVQIEWYPITYIPMYGSYMAPGVLAGIPEADSGDEARVREIARSCAGSHVFGYTRRCSWRIPRVLYERTTLELRGPGRPPTPFTGDVGWLRYALIEVLAFPAGGPQAREAADALERRVRTLLSASPSEALAGYDSFVLSYRLHEGLLPLVSGTLAPNR
jgi:hypothetical protein